MLAAPQALPPTVPRYRSLRSSRASHCPILGRSVLYLLSLSSINVAAECLVLQ